VEFRGKTKRRRGRSGSGQEKKWLAPKRENLPVKPGTTPEEVTSETNLGGRWVVQNRASRGDIRGGGKGAAQESYTGTVKRLGRMAAGAGKIWGMKKDEMVREIVHKRGEKVASEYEIWGVRGQRHQKKKEKNTPRF